MIERHHNNYRLICTPGMHTVGSRTETQKWHIVHMEVGTTRTIRTSEHNNMVQDSKKQYRNEEGRNVMIDFAERLDIMMA